MKKSKLRKIIRESIKELMTEEKKLAQSGTKNGLCWCVWQDQNDGTFSDNTTGCQPDINGSCDHCCHLVGPPSESIRRTGDEKQPTERENLTFTLTDKSGKTSEVDQNHPAAKEAMNSGRIHKTPTNPDHIVGGGGGRDICCKRAGGCCEHTKETEFGTIQWWACCNSPYTGLCCQIRSWGGNPRP